MDELISIIIPTYNRASSISKSVRSVLAQTYKNIEVIVVDDGSTDNTKQLIENICDYRLKYINLDTNAGACNARNKGIEMAKGDYIAFQDSDDVWKIDKLEKQIYALKKNNVDLVFCAYEKINEKKQIILPQLKEGYVSRKELLRQSIVSTQTLLGKKKCFEKVKFDESMPRLQDYDITIRLSKEFKFYFVQEALVEMNVGNDSISNNPKKLLYAEQCIMNKYKDELNEYKSFKMYNMGGMARAKLELSMYCTKDYLEIFNLSPSMKGFGKIIRAIFMDVMVYIKKG